MLKPLAFALISWGLMVGSAGAQIISPYGPRLGTPPLSPYLNLLNNGNPATNYYLQVQPELQRQSLNNALNAVNNDLLRPQNLQPEATLEDYLPTLPQTGHAAGFQSYGSYYAFPNMPRQFNPLTGQTPRQR